MLMLITQNWEVNQHKILKIATLIHKLRKDLFYTRIQISN